MDVMDVVWLVHGTQPEFIRCSDGLTTLYTATRHEHRESPWIVIATGLVVVGSLEKGRPSELSAPDDQCVFQHTARFEVRD